MKKICHSTRIYMHKFIVAFIISNVASIKNPPKLHSFVVINNVSRKFWSNHLGVADKSDELGHEFDCKLLKIFPVSMGIFQ